jgi:hypothetical protein
MLFAYYYKEDSLNQGSPNYKVLPPSFFLQQK